MHEQIKEIMEVAVKGGFDLDSYFGVDLSNRMGKMPEDDFGAKVWLLSGNDSVFLDPLFFKAIGKATGWGKVDVNASGDSPIWEEGWLHRAMDFHEINLTESLESAIQYLYEQVKNK